MTIESTDPRDQDNRSDQEPEEPATAEEIADLDDYIEWGLDSPAADSLKP